jgi:hypothetical protein
VRGGRAWCSSCNAPTTRHREGCKAASVGEHKPLPAACYGNDIACTDCGTFTCEKRGECKRYVPVTIKPEPAPWTFHDKCDGGWHECWHRGEWHVHTAGGWRAIRLTVDEYAEQAGRPRLHESRDAAMEWAEQQGELAKPAPAPFKIGDRVRCVSAPWPSTLGGPRVGDVCNVSRMLKLGDTEALALHEHSLVNGFPAACFEPAPADDAEQLREGWRFAGRETVTINGEARHLGYRERTDYVYKENSGAVWKCVDRWNWVGADGELHGDGTGNKPTRLEAMLAVEASQ